MSSFDRVFDDIPTTDQLIACYVQKAKPKLETRMGGYELDVRRNTRGLWKGYLGINDFISSMALTIQNGFTRAWQDGIATCGFKPQDMTILENARLQLEINSEINYVRNFAVSIRDNDQLSGGKLGPLIMRSQMWGLKYAYIYDLARTYACSDQKLEWRINITRFVKESCDDCLLLNGKVYRASEWRAHDLSPKSHRLKCGGWRCGCGFITTTKPVSVTPFPVI